MRDGLRDLLAFLGERRKLWLVPVVAVFLLAGVLVAVAEGGMALGFLYALF